MDVVYLSRPFDNEELRYSLRSLVNIHGVDRVWIFGGMPDWVQGVDFVSCPPRTTKYETTTANLRTALDNPAVSDPFILMNDDFYVMRAGGLPPIAHRGRVRDVIADQERTGSGRSAYTQGMRDTLARLEQHGHADPSSFELHIPLVVHKQAMRDALDLCVGIPVIHKRTAYAAVAGLRGRKLTDVKVYQHGPIPSGRFLSSQDDTFHRLAAILAETFPTPSPYES